MKKYLLILIAMLALTSNIAVGQIKPIKRGQKPKTESQKTKPKAEQNKKEKPKRAGSSKGNDKKTKDNNSHAQETKKLLKQDTTNNSSDNRAKNAFGGGEKGNEVDNSSQCVLAGKPSISGLMGYTLDDWVKPVPNSMWSGRVVVRVTVDRLGKVTKANAVSATGDLASHPEVRRSCEQAALKSTFLAPKNTMTEGIGTITYIWNNL